MKIAGEHRFDVAREQVWSALTDPSVLAASVPGVIRLETVGADDYRIALKAGIGSVTGTYEGTFALTDQQPPERCRIRATLSGAPGSVELLAELQLADGPDDGTVLGYAADATVTGALAGVGQRLLGTAAKRTTKQFLEAVERQIREPQQRARPVEEPAGGGATFEPATAASAPAPEPLAFALGAAAGALIALAGVAVGRWANRG